VAAVLPAVRPRGRHAADRLRPDAGVFLLGPSGCTRVFPDEVMCFAALRLRFNLLIGFSACLSFGHAMFPRTAGYVFAHAAKVWGVTPSSPSLPQPPPLRTWPRHGPARDRRQGIYFAMITLALAQISFSSACRPVHGPARTASKAGAARQAFRPHRPVEGLGHVRHRAVIFVRFSGHLPDDPLALRPGAEAIREKRARAISLGYDTDRYKLAAFVISRRSPASGATNALSSSSRRQHVHWACRARSC